MSEFAGDRAFPRWLVVLLGVAATVVGVAGLRSSAEILAPILLALMLVIAAHPVLSWARAHGAPQWLAVTLALVVLYTVVLGLVVTLVISVARLAALLPQYRDQIGGLLGDVRSLLTSAGVGREQVASAFAGIDPQSVLGFVSGIVSGLLGALGTLVFVLATVLFMGVDASGLPDRLRAVPGVVTVQMVFNLVVLASAARVLARGISRRSRMSHRAGSRSEGVVPVHGETPDHRDVHPDDQQ
jgi:predicted PurR-regulated permease PerM